MYTNKITVAELYRLVWSKPAVQVAERLGVSNVYVRKLCIKHGVPYPPRGHWNKSAAAQAAVVPPALPRSCEPNKVLRFLTDLMPKPNPDVPTRLQALEQRQKAQLDKIAWDLMQEAADGWHRFERLRQFVSHLEGVGVLDERSAEKIEWAKRRLADADPLASGTAIFFERLFARAVEKARHST